MTCFPGKSYFSLSGQEISSKSQARGVSSWEVLREIFWPGDVLVTRVRNHPRAYRLRNVYYRENCQQKWLEINAEYIDYDGKDFGTCVETFTISQYPGVQYIEQLSIFPLKYSSRKDEFTAPLLKRGKHFASLTGQCYRSHAGVGRTLCLGKKTSVCTFPQHIFQIIMIILEADGEHQL